MRNFDNLGPGPKIVSAPVLVVGPGAIGLSLAAGLRRTGTAVAILGRNAAAERALARSGFAATHPDGRRETVKGLVPARSLKSPASAALFCVKSGDARRAALAARRWIGPATAVVALQNGIGHEKVFRRAFGPKRTVIGVCYFAADRTGAGELKLNGGEDVLLARRKGNEAALEAARALLTGAGFRVHLKDSEEGMLWTKAAFNAAVNPLGAACAVESGRLEADPALRELSLRALEEATSAAAASGHTLDYPDMAEKLMLSCRNAPKQRNSMLQDLAAGRRTEAKAILGPLLDAARRRRVPAPTLETLAAVIAKLERRLAA
ncbi:MAG: 2-dehydropantoate 2-reductase [Elusimicrobiota bacterium]|nr:MAG: 2-dehydropantoate 2-reductase [Elusimicrobiota bacterium]